MGNTDSQYSSFIIPGKSKTCSLKLHSPKDDLLSPHSWWRGTERPVGYKSQGPSKNGLSHHKSNQPYISGHYDYVKGPGSLPRFCPGDETILPQGNGCFSRCGPQEGEGNGFRTPRSGTPPPLENRSSPKVLFSQDGSLRVEFTNARRELKAESEEMDGAPAEVTLRASKGSSLSSEGSWYDSPWGNATELCDNVFTTNQQDNNSSSGYTTLSSTRTEDNGCNSYATGLELHPGGYNGGFLCQRSSAGYNSSGYNTCSSGRTEDSGLGESVLLQPEQREFGTNSPPPSLSDLYTNPSLSGPFPTNSTLPLPQFPNTPLLGASLASGLDAGVREENLDPSCYTSHTLPCRKGGNDLVPGGNARKDSLKSRIRRLSDWTGSLSRKKRRLQEPSTLEISEAFPGGCTDLLVGDSCSQLTTAPCWNPISTQAQASPSGSSAVASQNGAALRQNIYENFMQELEIGGNGEARAWEGEQGESSSGSLGSLEQLDLLFEKEQGVVRRAGWLAFKPLISIHKERKLELVSRRKWRQYWVTLKGCMLLFYETYGKSCQEQDLAPRYALLAEDSIVQAIPEHPKKENVFCLSNAYGDVFLFQAANQPDLENWVTAIHSASASHLAKRQGKEDTLKLLKSQSRSLLQKIDMDSKMKKMAELQLSVVSDHRNRKAIESQIQQWEQNLEKFNMELFRMRCYLASLQGTELPNPKSLLATASRPSKVALSRLGIFSVSSFHALICTRDEATLRRRSRSHCRAARNKRGLFSSQKGLDSLTKHSREKRQSVSQIFEGYSTGTLGHSPTQSSSEQRLDSFAKSHSAAPPEGHPWECTWENLVYVCMPDNQVVTVPVKADFLVADVLSMACKVKQLEPALHGLLVKRHSGQCVEVSMPAATDLLRDLVFDELEVCPLNVFTLNLSRADPAADYGFAVTGHVDGLGRSHIYVSEVHPAGVAFSEGLRAGDEILVLNGASVAALDLGLMQSFFTQNTLRLLLRRDDATVTEEQASTWPDCDLSEPCRPHLPPGHAQLIEQLSADVSQIPDGSDGSVTAVSEDSDVRPGHTAGPDRHRKSVETVCSLYQTYPEGPSLVPEGHRNPYSSEPAPSKSCPRHLSVTEKLRKVIQELVDTEKSYVKDLGYLFEIYLKPLQSETFLSQDEMECLFGSLPEMLDFQRVFLQTLEERTSSISEFSTLDSPEQLKKLLFSLGGSFLYYADHFKLYSGFCANHIKVQKVLERAKTDRAFKEFLEAKNPTKQHSSTLESYLIKPVQRVLKYPLLLRELVSLTDSESEEHSHLTEALRAMEKVASHINEMQKIYEDYGTVFDQLVAEQSGTKKEVTEISMGEFLLHCSALWLNPLPSLGRMRKDPDLTLFIFKRALILVYRESSKMKKRMTASRSTYSQGDLDPFKFRWLIPASALQVRLGNSAGTENPCVWELVHTKSEVEGRPETVFQLCSSNLESKANAVKAIRSLLRENARKTAPAETRAFRDHLTFPRRSHPAAVRTSSWVPQQPSHSSELRSSQPDLAERRMVSSLKDNHLEPQLPSQQSSGAPRKESSSLDERARLCSLTSALEAQLQRLNFAEEPLGGHGRSNNLEEAPGVDLNDLLGRDYSVQSLSSVVNEDCFYDTVVGIQKAAIPTL
ncbi:T-lymphoma invasion and metastasis-inducing protein 2 [Chanos chanos]|uniref:T-lymphoma invasion and metastasis-inducing protein 2 n=1 Tax=Chanos chanos TaxID=29144 RepID=A0A6J2V4Q4_CHACN|nr:T-lymphoma invasion and metastasis-inducing protein 2-like [Chanos chanos]